MIKLSIIQNFNKVAGYREFSEIIEAIKNGKFKNEIEQLQIILKDGDEKEYAKRKKSLLAFTPSGRFEGGRKPEYLKEYSGIIVLDIDKSNENTEKFKSIIISSPYTYACFISPGGNGLKVFVQIETSPEKHNDSFNRIKKYYEGLIQFKVDPSGKDITRLCFFSYDKEAYFNEKAWTFNYKEEKEKPDYNKLFTQQVEFTGKLVQYVKGSRNNYIYRLACNCNRAGIPKNITDSFIRQNYDLESMEIEKSVSSAYKNNNQEFGDKTENVKNEKKHTSNKFTITEEYLNEKYIIRYNVVSNKFEYKGKDETKYRELNENNLFVKLQKDNVNISLNNLVALLKSDFVNEFNPFIEYFRSLPEWDGQTDYIGQLVSYLKSPDEERLNRHFKKWLVRVVRTAIDDYYYNKQAFVLVSNQQNSGKSTFCRFLCPTMLKDYIVENIGTDKDSLIAITENFLINLDELSTAEKAEINTFKSMFSKDKVKARLTYDKRPSIHVRRASFLGSTDRWEFLTDENGSVRWLCFDVKFIDWNYSKEIVIDLVYAQAYHLLTRTKFNYELTAEEIEENDRINKKYQVSSPERDLIQKFFNPGKPEKDQFYTATEILDHISHFTTIKLSSERIGKELKFLGYERSVMYLNGNNRYGYFLQEITN